MYDLCNPKSGPNFYIEERIVLEKEQLKNINSSQNEGGT